MNVFREMGYQSPAENNEDDVRHSVEVVGSIILDNERVCGYRRYIRILSVIAMELNIRLER